MSVLNAPAHVNFASTETVVEHFKAFTNYLNQQTKLHADKVYIRYSSDGTFKTLTYADVDRIAVNLACKLAKHVQNIEVVSFISDHSVSYLMVMLAILKLRTTLLAISPRNSEAAAVHLLEKTGSKLLIADAKYEAVAKGAVSKVPGAEILTLSPFDIEALAKEPLDPFHSQVLDLDFSDEDILKTALIIHSSGTTAFPKPVRYTNRYLFYAITIFEILINNNSKLESLTEADVLLPIAPLFHILGVSLIFAVIAFGGNCVFLEKLPPSQAEISNAIAVNKVTVFGAPPLVYEQMVAYLKKTKELALVQRLKYALTGGAPLKDSLLEWFYRNNINVRVLYGSTETGTIMSSDFDRTSKNYSSLRLYQMDTQGVSYGVFETNDSKEPHIKHLYIRAGSPILGAHVANRADGGYNTQDLFIEDPRYPGCYNYVGRRDDTLIMKNGEKTNPVPMETTIRQSPMVQQAAIIGHGRECTAALIQLNKAVAQQCSQEDIHAAINAIIKETNRECPNHSKIFPEMVKILPVDQVLPSTDKGTVMRRKAESLYQEEVDMLYKNFLEASPHANSPNADTSAWTAEQIEDFLIDCASKVLDIPRTMIEDRPQSLFDYGLNSVNAIQLRHLIAQHFEDVAPNFLFQHYSIKSMRKALMSRKSECSSEQMERRYQETQRLTEHYIKRAKVDFPRASNRYVRKKSKVILLTGVTGSLGSFILRELLRDSTVEKIYCCVRGDDHQLKDRLVEAITSRSLDASLLDTERVEVLPMRFNEPLLGFSFERYNQLKNEVTIVQHCAWLLNFNMPIDYFDRECIQPFYNLLKFAYKEVNPMHVHFISSISASAAAGNEVAEEPLPLDSHVAMPMGYAQSKFVVEILFNYLTVEKNFPCYIERLGQVCGDSINGVWNVSEQYPLMFIGGGSVMHKMPGLDTAIDWITVDYAAASIADIMLRTAYLPANTDQSVYHIVNPHLITWSDILLAMKKSGMKFEVVEPTKWVEYLAQDDTNPAFRLMPFYQDNFTKESFKMSVWRTEKTSAFTPIISKSPVLDADLFSKFLNHWKSVGFYKPPV
ncbi:hypothetical protein [Parasitella parasitica]|uniref:Polyketide synthase-like phosphopantetheine-binding domain-containing protein n=1 Tax=Parasitella parasitica TaxID=35722 RepID=A0A0B7NKW2_9FUNG|nr:hypothetical protein [Parasitella parasitica]